jgi:hypothetical protein
MVNLNSLYTQIESLIANAINQNIDLETLKSQILQTLSSEIQSDLDLFKQQVNDLISQHELPANLQERLQNIETRLTAEENKPDQDTIFDDTAIRQLIQQAIADHDNFVTAENA